MNFRVLMEYFASSGATGTMRPGRLTIAAGLIVALLATLAACGGGGGGGGSSGGTTVTPPPVTGPAWGGFGNNAQHTDLGATLALGGVAAQNLGQIVWEASVDTAVNQNNAIHYGSPMITANDTVLVPVKTATNGSFQMQARAGNNKGALIWSANSDYILPPLATNVWIPVFGATLTHANRLYMPGSGGKVYYLDNPDSAGGALQTVVFYGASAYASAPSSFDGSIFIDTPITADASGNIYFGYTVTGANPAGITSGFARIGADGKTTWVAANSAAGQTTAMTPSMNAAPGVSNDGTTVYVSVHTVPASTTDIGTGYLLALDSTTLTTRNAAKLLDPNTQQPAWVNDSSTASPVIGPDGDVYYGVLESNFPAHNDRGWLLHFDSTLAVVKTPGSFGWDNTASIVPAGLVSSYTGKSSYLLLSKYNNYADFPTGDGKNRMAILDPNQTEADPVLGNPVMNEVMTVLGPTSDATSFPNDPGAVKEWCVNSSAIDPITKSAFMNSEDGYLYRWDLTTGTLSQKIWLDNGYGQAYTPTALGPDGTIYSINAGSLIAVTK